MTERPSWPRRLALALMKHAAWVIPAARGPWATAMRHELSEIESDLEALTWAGGCLAAGYAERSRAIGAKTGMAALLVLAAIVAGSWWAGQRPFLTPGHDQVFREASDAGGWIGLLVSVAGILTGMWALILWINDRNFHKAARAGRIFAIIVVPYVAALAVTSLLTPGTIVNIGDSYCYDLWCVGVNRVNASPRGQDVLYTADVRIFVDSTHPHQLPAELARRFFDVLDERGRRYQLLAEASFVDADVTVHPGEMVKSSLAFLAPPNARRLYLIGKDGGLPWVYLYFGSDISLFHRPALLRIL
jgi:hypothetical protein